MLRPLTCARARSGSIARSPRPHVSLLARCAAGAWGVWLLALAAACGDSARPPADAGLGDDAALSCTPGTVQCACSSAGGCQDNLLCISGRCLATEGPRSPEMDDGVRGPAQPLPPSVEDAAPPVASPADADATAGDNPDAATLPPQLPPDASVDASP